MPDSSSEENQPSLGRYSVSPFLKQEVSDQIRRRDPHARVSWNWYDTWQEEHHRAFVVAKMCKADLLQEVHDSLQKAVDTGMTFEEWKKDIVPKLEGKWLGRTYGDIWVNDLGRDIEDLPEKQRDKIIAPKRLETIYRTNMKVAHAAGQYESLMDMADLYPYWRYCTQEDERVRKGHAALNDKVFRHDDPFWDTHYPPNGWNCRCYVRAMDEDDLEDEGLTVSSSADFQKVAEASAGDHTKLAYIIDGQTVSTADGWNYNPGRIRHVDFVAQDKVAGYAPELREQVAKDLAGEKAGRVPELREQVKRDLAGEKAGRVPELRAQVEREVGQEFKTKEENGKNAGTDIGTLRKITINTLSEEEVEKAKAVCQTAPTYTVIRDKRADCKQIYDVLQEACKDAKESGGLIDCSQLQGFSREQIEHCISIQNIEFVFCFGGEDGNKLMCGAVGNAESVRIREVLASCITDPTAKDQYTGIMAELKNRRVTREEAISKVDSLIRGYVTSQGIWKVSHNHPNGSVFSVEDVKPFSSLCLAVIKMVYKDLWCSLDVSDLDYPERNKVYVKLIPLARDAANAVIKDSITMGNVESKDEHTSQQAFVKMCKTYQGMLGAYKEHFKF